MTLRELRMNCVVFLVALTFDRLDFALFIIFKFEIITFAFCLTKTGQVVISTTCPWESVASLLEAPRHKWRGFL